MGGRLWWWSALLAALVLSFLIDHPLIALLEPVNHGPLEHVLSNTVRWLGNGVIQVPILLLVVLAGAIWSRRALRAGAWGLLAFAVSGAFAVPLKILVARSRPWVGPAPPDYWSNLIYMSDYMSFPSGDAATSFAIVTVLAAWYPRLRRLLFATAAAVAAARIFVGSHYPSDVAAGTLLGLGAGQLLLSLRRPGASDAAGVSSNPQFGAWSARLGRVDVLLLAAGSACLLLGGLGWLPLFGRDEALYAEAAREMLATGDWVTPTVNGAPFFEKPPLYYWMAAAAYRILGVSPLSARLPAALAGLVTVAVTATVGARVWGRRAGLLAGLALATSLQLVMIGRMGLMDVPLTCLVALAVVAYAKWRRSGSVSAALALGALTGLGILLKGMAAGIIPAIAVVHLLVFRRDRAAISVGSLTLAAAACACVALPWFIAMALRHGEAHLSILFLREHLARIARPMQGHGGPVFYYAVVIGITFFPWVCLLPAALRRRAQAGCEREALWHSLMIVWVAVTLIPFSLVRTKLPGYVTPLFPAMALLVGVELDRQLSRVRRGPWIATIIGAMLFGALVSLLPWGGHRLGEPLGAGHEAQRLVAPALVWYAACLVMVLGAVQALAGRRSLGLGGIVVGQTAVLLSVLFGVLPVLSPYLGGGAAGLAEFAERSMPNRELVLYETRPEAVAFALERTVRVFSRQQQDQLLDRLRQRPSALIAPAGEEELWRTLPVRGVWRMGDRMLLDVSPPAGSQKAAPPA